MHMQHMHTCCGACLDTKCGVVFCCVLLAGTQTEPVVTPVSHVSTQAAAEAVAAGVQTTPPSPVAAAVQAELRPEVSEVGSQADLSAAAAAAAQAQVTPAAAGEDLSPESSLLEARQQHGSGIIYSASGSELSVDKAAVGQQLDILHRIERSRAGDVPADDEGVPGAAAVLEVKPEELQDLPAVAKGAHGFCVPACMGLSITQHAVALGSTHAQLAGIY
jgi:hypothetical protein